MNKSEQELFERASKLVTKEMDERSIFHTELLTKLEKWWKHYNGQQAETSYKEGLSKAFPMETFTHIETWVPRLVDLITLVYPFFGVKYRSGGQSDPAICSNVKKLLLYDIERGDVITNFEEAMRSLTVEGSLVVKVPYDMTEENFIKMERSYTTQSVPTGKMDGYGMPVMQNVDIPKIEEKEIIRNFDGTKFLPRDLKYTYLDNSKRFEDQSVIEECEITWEEFTNGTEGDTPTYKNYDKVKEVIYDKALEEDRNRGIKFKILERWGLFILDKDAVGVNGKRVYEEGNEPYPVECVIATLKEYDRVTIRVEVNPFWHRRKPYLFVPFIRTKDKGSYQLYGVGVAEILFSDQVELADTHRQVIDNKSMLLWGELLVNRGAAIKKQHLKERKIGKIIFHSAPTPEAAIGRIPYPDFTATGTNMESVIRRDMIAASNAILPLQGMKEGGGREPATSSERRVREASRRIGLILGRIEECILLPFLEMCYSLDLQYKRDIKINDILGGMAKDEKLQYTKIDVVGDIEFELYGSIRMDNDMVKRKEAENRLAILMNDPLTNQLQLRKDYWETQGIDHPEQYINQEPMIPLSQVKQMMAEQEQKKAKTEGAKRRSDSVSVEDIMRSVNPMETIKGVTEG